MKAKVELEIDKDDLQYELKELVSETATPELKKIIKSHAQPLVQEEVDKVLLPIVASVLTNEDLTFNYGYHDYPNDDKLKNRVESFTKQFLNKSVYLYDKNATEPSRRYLPSQHGNTLIHNIVFDCIKEYVDTEFKPDVEKMVKEFLTNKNRMKEMFKEEAKKLLAEMK